MAELRALCAELGWAGRRHLYPERQRRLHRAGKPDALEKVLEEAIAERFGLDVPVIVRTAAQWAEYPHRQPVSQSGAGRAQPADAAPVQERRPPRAPRRSSRRARSAGEQVKRAGDALWFHYPEGAGTSKLTPSLIDRAVGSPATARNYRTVVTLLDMLRA